MLAQARAAEAAVEAIQAAADAVKAAGGVTVEGTTIVVQAVHVAGRRGARTLEGSDSKRTLLYLLGDQPMRT